MWQIKKIEYYVVTNGVISTGTYHTYFEDAQQELTDILEEIETLSHQIEETNES